MRKTRFVFGFLVLCTLIGLAPSGLSLPGEASAAEKIVFGLDWVPYGKYVGYYVARDKGFYKEAGFDVTFERGYGGASTQVGNGNQQYGIESVGGVVIARNKNVPVKLISMWHERLMMSVVVLKNSGIQTPKDLKGRKLGVTIGDAIHRNWPVFAERVGLKDWNFVPMDPAAKNPALLAKKVDGILTYATVTISLRVQAKKMGEEVVEFLFSDHGVRLANDGLIAHDKTIAEKPDQGRRFVAASLKGNAWAIEHPEEGVNVFLKYIPDASREMTRFSWDLSSRFQVWGSLKEHGLGYMDRDMMESTRKTMARVYKMQNPPPLDDLYTTKLLPKQLPKPKLPAM
ncbi:MAG: ABC transporter substrate-binding protein [Candidatus Tectomicrobia bacterium]|nr:ABC transporter substrate-binding protein [Candidatus Tectomicrobia bacterium]